MPEKLKPCPFCGGEAIIKKDFDFRAFCENELCFTNGFRESPYQKVAIRKWNNRPAEKAAREEVLEMAIKEMLDCYWHELSDSEIEETLRQAYKERFNE